MSQLARRREIEVIEARLRFLEEAEDAYMCPAWRDYAEEEVQVYQIRLHLLKMEEAQDGKGKGTDLPTEDHTPG